MISSIHDCDRVLLFPSAQSDDAANALKLRLLPLYAEYLGTSLESLPQWIRVKAASMEGAIEGASLPVSCRGLQRETTLASVCPCFPRLWLSYIHGIKEQHSIDVIAMQPCEIKKLRPADFEALGLHIRFLTQEMVELILPEQMKALSTFQVKALPYCAALSKDQVQALEKFQILALMPTQLKEVNITFLSRRQIHWLSSDQIAALSLAQLLKLEREQIGALSQEQVNMLPIDFFSTNFEKLTQALTCYPTPDQIVALEDAWAQSSVREEQQVQQRLPHAHALTKYEGRPPDYSVTAILSCDVCGSSPIRVMYHCAQCRYDECENCHSTSANKPSPATGGVTGVVSPGAGATAGLPLLPDSDDEAQAAGVGLSTRSAALESAE